MRSLNERRESCHQARRRAAGNNTAAVTQLELLHGVLMETPRERRAGLAVFTKALQELG